MQLVRQGSHILAQSVIGVVATERSEQGYKLKMWVILKLTY